MSTTLDPLVLDLVEWVAKEPRRYAEVIDVWRTSCPRLTVWEDAVDRGYVIRDAGAGRGTMVVLTDKGRRFLGEHGRAPSPPCDSAAHDGHVENRLAKSVRGT
jgi:hypothetical protein